MANALDKRLERWVSAGIVVAGAVGGSVRRSTTLRRSLAVCGRALGRTLAGLAFHAGSYPCSCVPYCRGSNRGTVLGAGNDILCHRNGLCRCGNFSDGANFQSSGALANWDSDVGSRSACRLASLEALDAGRSACFAGARVACGRMGSAHSEICREQPADHRRVGADRDHLPECQDEPRRFQHAACAGVDRRTSSVATSRVGVLRRAGNLGMVAESHASLISIPNHWVGHRDLWTTCAGLRAAQERGVDKCNRGSVGLGDRNVWRQA